MFTENRTPSATALLRMARQLAGRPQGSTPSVNVMPDPVVGPGGPVLEQPERGAAPRDPGLVVQRVGLHVHVEAGHPVGGDHGLVGPGDRGHAPARVGDLGAVLVGAVPAEGRRRLPAHGAQRLDLGGVAAAWLHGLLGAAVPGEGARALFRCLEEGQGQVAGPGGAGYGGQLVLGPRLEVRGVAGPGVVAATLGTDGALRGGGGRRHGHRQREGQEKGQDRACAPVRHAPILPLRR